jgi:hypothetical protein
MIEYVQWIVPVAAAAAAWGGTRQALNGTRERVKGIDRKLDLQMEKQSIITERLASVETKVNDHIQIYCKRDHRGDRS